MVLGSIGGFLGKLGSDAIRNMVSNLLPGFYERGISANQALRELREQGLGYRRSDFLSDYRSGLGEYEQATRVKFVNENATPTEGILEPKYHGVPDKYSFVFRQSGYDESTGESIDRYFYYHRNDLQTRQEMELDAEDWVSAEANNYGIITTNVSIVEGYINPIWA